MRTTDDELPPILTDKDYRAPSAFTPESLLREARRQKSTAAEQVPAVCLLDPDGDIVHQLKAEDRAARHDGWVCYPPDLSDRKSVVSGKSVAVRVDLGGRRSIPKKKAKKIR